MPTKVCLVKGMVFPVVMYGSESWTIKKAECWRTDAFELWCWRRLLSLPGLQGNPTSQSKKKSVLNVHFWKNWCWSWNSNTLFGHLMRRTDSLERPWHWERLKAGEKGDDRGWDGWMASTTQWTWIGLNSGSCWWTGRPGRLQSMGSWRVGHDWVTELNWTAAQVSLLIAQKGQAGSLHGVRVGVCTRFRLEKWLRQFAHPFVGIGYKEHAPCFCYQLFTSCSW